MPSYKDGFQSNFLVSAFVLVLIIFKLFETKVASFHFYDDWEIFRIRDRIASNGFRETLLSWVTSDAELNGRVRPFYWVLRFIEIEIAGDNPRIWVLINIGILVFTVFLVFLSLSLIIQSTRNRIILTTAFFFGQQSAIWWRFATAENFAIVILLALFLLVYKTKVHNIRSLISVFILSVCLCLTKESFALAFPFLLFFGFIKDKSTLLSYIRKRLSLFTAISLPSLVFIALLLIMQGKNSKYSSNYGIFEPLVLVKSIIRFGNISFYFGLFLLIFSCMLIQGDKPKAFRSMFVIFVSLAPQFVLYSEVGIVERYSMPSNMFLIFVIALSADRIDSISKNISWTYSFSLISLSIYFSSTKYNFLFILLSTCLLIFLVRRKSSGIRVPCSNTWPVLRLVFIIQLGLSIGFTTINYLSYLNESISSRQWISSINRDYSKSEPVVLLFDPVRHYQWALTSWYLLKNAGYQQLVVRDINLDINYIRNEYDFALIQNYRDIVGNSLPMPKSYEFYVTAKETYCTFWKADYRLEMGNLNCDLSDNPVVSFNSLDNSFISSQ
jgi:hypothetical protein